MAKTHSGVVLVQGKQRTGISSEHVADSLLSIRKQESPPAHPAGKIPADQGAGNTEENAFRVGTGALSPPTPAVYWAPGTAPRLILLTPRMKICVRELKIRTRE